MGPTSNQTIWANEQTSSPRSKQTVKTSKQISKQPVKKEKKKKEKKENEKEEEEEEEEGGRRRTGCILKREPTP